MIYGHIEEWILRENPAFARAVAEDYSILRGDTNAAAFGEVAYWQMGEQLLSQMPADPAAIVPSLNSCHAIAPSLGSGSGRAALTVRSSLWHR